MCGMYLNRARIVVLGAMIPVTVLLLLSETILVGLGLDPEACYYT
jgi:uncharacterized SAM-binding protein YcdF (DUF218 family)